MQRKVFVLPIVLIFVNVIIWSQVTVASGGKLGENNELTISFLDIGQGDSVYIEAPNGRQMIIDGGPNENLLTALPEFLPFGDKTIDVLVITNPDADHYAGFIPLLEKFSVGAVVEPGTRSGTSLYKTLEAAIVNENVPHVLAMKGEKIILDQQKNIYFEILFPDRDVSMWESNDGSIVGRLVDGDISILFTGDGTKLTEGIVVFGNDLSGTEILKVGHHGSKTSTGTPLLTEASPSIAIISAGKDNRYGHPSKETTDRLDEENIPYLVTMDEGTVTFVTDGKIVKRK